MKDKTMRVMNGNSSVVEKESLGDFAGGPTASKEMLLSLPSGQCLAALFEPASVGAEKFRALAARLRYLQQQRDLKKLVIASAVQGDGKSIVSANVAISLARRQKTVLIDGDLRRSGLRVLLETRNLHGLTDWWQGAEPIRNFLWRVEGLSLWHLPAGRIVEQPLEILQSQRMSDMLLELSESFEWVIIDSPPLLPVADGHVWATHADGTLLVVRQGKTPKKPLENALEDVENLKLLGAVMNASQETHQQYYSQYYNGREIASAVRERPVSKPESLSTTIVPRK